MVTPDSAAQWFVSAGADREAPYQAFAFPQAGGGCASFAEVAPHVRGELELWTVNLPGRQARFLEEPRIRLRPLVEELADALPKYRDGRPYVLIGYCAGALFAYALAEELQRRGAPAAERLITVSFASPRHLEADAELIDAPAEQFWKRVVAAGGVHPAVAGDPDAAEIFEPGLRADYRLLADWVPAGQPLAVPVTAMFGVEDDHLDREMVEDWETWTSAGACARRILGGHWQLEGDPVSLASLLVGSMYGFRPA